MMRPIGGNVTATIQIKQTTRNEIGEMVVSWLDVQEVTGFLDYQSGDSRYNTYQAKMQESTHVFVMDHVLLDSRITSNDSRMSVNGKSYDILLIDNPMELNYQYEIYLRFVG